MSVSKPHIIYYTELTHKFVSRSDNIFPVNKNNVLIGGERGFYHINFDQYKTIRYPLRVLITSVNAINKKDSLLFGGYSGEVNADDAVLKKKTPGVSHS